MYFQHNNTSNFELKKANYKDITWVRLCLVGKSEDAKLTTSTSQ